MVEVLNHLYLGGTKVKASPTLNSAQRESLDGLVDDAEHFLSLEMTIPTLPELIENLGKVRFDYSGEIVQVMEDLEAESVISCWPKPGEVGIQPAERFVTEEVREWLLKPRSFSTMLLASVAAQESRESF